MYKPGHTMKSKRLLIQAVQAFQQNDMKRSGQLFAAAMNERDIKQLLHELSAPTNMSMSAVPLRVGMNNELMHDLDLPIGDNRQQFQNRLSDKYPQMAVQDVETLIPLVPATDGSAMPQSGGYLSEIDEMDEDEAKIEEELEDDPEHAPSSISKAEPLESNSANEDQEVEYGTGYVIKPRADKPNSKRPQRITL